MARLNGQWRSGNALEDQRDIVDRVVNALIPPITDIDCSSQEARHRREVHREVSRQIGRALWRADRRARQVPTHVRASSTYVMRRRRKIAYEVSRAVRSLGAGEELARVIAEKAAMRWPRDGVILPDATERPDRPSRPRARGESPRQRGKSPRDTGTSLRDRKVNPRALRKRAAGDLSDPVINAAPQLALAPPGFSSTALSAMLPPMELPSAAAAPSGSARSIDEIAPEWRDVKLKTLEGLDVQTQAKAIRMGREERRRVEELQRVQSLKPRSE